MFYASYPDSELTFAQENPPLAHEYLHFTKQTTFRDTRSYVQGESYKSPLNDLLALFNTVDVKSKLTIHLTLQFKIEEK